MKELRLLMISLFFTILIAGCTGAKADNQSAQIGKLINKQDRIKAVDIIESATEEKTVTLSDATDISTFINMIKEIPVNKLSKSEDNDFMLERIRDDSLLNVCFYTDDTARKSMAGMLFIWPDGYVYAVDVGSMQSSERTIAYLSESRYPEIYEHLKKHLP
ncbi:hypothetical protein [Syntrophomonas curvata]